MRMALYIFVRVSESSVNQPATDKRVSAVTSVQQYATENTDTSLQAGLYFKLYFKRALCEKSTLTLKRSLAFT